MRYRCLVPSLAAVLLLSCALQAASQPVTANSSEARITATPIPTKVFVCADSGEYSGAHELGFLYAAMEDREALRLPYCQSAYLGYLTHAEGHRIRALAVTTGIGYVSAAVCTQQVLALQRERGLSFDSAVLIGTSGFSPFVGGWNPVNATLARGTVEGADGSPHTHPAAAPPARKYQATKERRLDAARDLLRAAKHDEADTTRRPTDGRTAVNGIAANVNWEHVKSQRQVKPDGCSPLRTTTEEEGSSSHRGALAGLRYSKKLAVGSICVTTASFLQETGLCTEVMNINQCSRPNCFRTMNMVNDRNIHAAHSRASQQLAADIMAASAGKPFPDVPPTVREGMRGFWDSNEAAAKDASDDEGDDGVPTPAFVHCAESTMNAIFVGAERDFFCRENTAVVLNRQRQALEKGDDGSVSDTLAAQDSPYTPDNVVCVQAMEAFGFLESMSVYPDIPVAVIRTASNYDMYPQQKMFMPRNSVVGGPEPDIEDTDDPVMPYVWRQNVNYVSREAYEKFVLASFHYSVKTAAFVVNNYFLGGRDLSQFTSTP